MAPVMVGAAAYGVHAENQLTTAHEQALENLQATVAAHRDGLRTEHEAMLAELRGEGERQRAELAQTADQLREVARTMIDRIESTAFEARDDLQRVAAQLRGEGDERLDVLEDHLRTALERIRIEVNDATHDAMTRIRAAADQAIAPLSDPVTVERAPAAPAFYLSPEQTEDDDVDLG